MNVPSSLMRVVRSTKGGWEDRWNDIRGREERKDIDILSFLLYFLSSYVPGKYKQTID